MLSLAVVPVGVDRASQSPDALAPVTRKSPEEVIAVIAGISKNS